MNALAQLKNHPHITLEKYSSFYSSKPLGPQDQPDFINAVCQISTSLPPATLLHETQKIEKNQGRIKLRHWGERCIDLDILLYGNLHLKSETLTIPHPEISQRDFVLTPLLEIAPNLIIPKVGPLNALLPSVTSNLLVKLDITG